MLPSLVMARRSRLNGKLYRVIHPLAFRMFGHSADSYHRAGLTINTTTELLLLTALVKPSSAVLDLGVTIDGQLTMADHVAALLQNSKLICLAASASEVSV